MKKNTAILLVGLAGVGAYFIFRKKQPVQSLKVQSKSKELEEIATTQTTRVKCNDGYEDVANGIVAPCIGHGGQKWDSYFIDNDWYTKARDAMKDARAHLYFSDNVANQYLTEIGSQIQESSNQVQVQGMPNFGRPLVMMNYQNYVDVQKNSYFKPKEGAFFR